MQTGTLTDVAASATRTEVDTTSADDTNIGTSVSVGPNAQGCTMVGTNDPNTLTARVTGDYVCGYGGIDTITRSGFTARSTS